MYYGHWADPNPEQCLCCGKGWAFVKEKNDWRKCPIHYKGQPNPEDCLEECPECGDGKLFSPLECSRCGDNLREQLNEPDDQKPPF